MRPAERVEELKGELHDALERRGLPLLGALPYSPVLSSTRLDEVQSALGASLHQRHSQLDIGIDKVSSPDLNLQPVSLGVCSQGLRPLTGNSISEGCWPKSCVYTKIFQDSDKGTSSR